MYRKLPDCPRDGECSGMLSNMSRRQAWLAPGTHRIRPLCLARLQVVQGTLPALGPEYSSSPCVSRNADTQEEGETCVVPREPGPVWGAGTLAYVDLVLQSKKNEMSQETFKLSPFSTPSVSDHTGPDSMRNGTRLFLVSRACPGRSGPVLTHYLLSA